MLQQAAAAHGAARRRAGRGAARAWPLAARRQTASARGAAAAEPRAAARARRAARAPGELLRLNRELEDTNRGVVALYAELEEKADRLRRADETQVALPVQHEPRVPHAAQLDPRAHRPAARPQSTARSTPSRQAGRASSARRRATSRSWSTTCSTSRRSRRARSTCGRPNSRPRRCSARCAACCGRCWSATTVALRFEAAPDLPPLYTDEAKVSQILRNFISNALKFTERGEIRVTAALDRGRATPSRSRSPTPASASRTRIRS